MREGQKNLVEQQRESPLHQPPPQAPTTPQPPQHAPLVPHSTAAGLAASLGLGASPSLPVSAASHLLQQHQRTSADEHKRASSSDSFCKDDRDSPILNLSSKSAHENTSDLSADDDVYVSENDDDLASNEEKSKMDKDSDKSDDKVNNNGTSALTAPVSCYQIIFGQ